MSNNMEFENQIMRMIFIYCDQNKIEIGADAAWELAKQVCAIAKQKTKNEIINSMNEYAQ